MLRPGRPTRDPLWRESLGALLRELRHERGKTLGDIAERAGVSPQYLSEMERGVKDPSSEMIAAVAGALEVTVMDLARGVADGPEGLRPSTKPAPTGGVVLAAPFGLAA